MKNHPKQVQLQKVQDSYLCSATPRCRIKNSFYLIGQPQNRTSTLFSIHSSRLFLQTDAENGGQFIFQCIAVCILSYYFKGHIRRMPHKWPPLLQSALSRWPVCSYPQSHGRLLLLLFSYLSGEWWGSPRQQYFSVSPGQAPVSALSPNGFNFMPVTCLSICCQHSFCMTASLCNTY